MENTLAKLAEIRKAFTGRCLFDVVEERQALCGEVGSVDVSLNVFDDEGFFLGRDYLYNTKFSF